MSRPLELDFFSMEKGSCNNNNNTSSVDTDVSNTTDKKPQFDRRLSFRGIQNAISKINPEILKSVITSGTAPSTSLPQSAKPISVPSEQQKDLFPNLPVLRAIGETTADGGVPMTIFYNGTVSVFNVSPDKAENIIKIATEGISKNGDAAGANQPKDFFGVLGSGTDLPLARKKSLQRFFQKRVTPDLPMARKKSLQRFFEKRKERLVSVSPYGDPSVGSQRGFGPKSNISNGLLEATT